MSNPSFSNNLNLFLYFLKISKLITQDAPAVAQVSNLLFELFINGYSFKFSNFIITFTAKKLNSIIVPHF